MSARRNTILAVLTLSLFIFAGTASAAPESETPPGTALTIDYDGFVTLSSELAEYRMQRLVPLGQFNEMATEPNTIILDTRSAEAFEMGHIEGAIHLNFSDFTDEKLAEAIPSTDTRILIYCNNNFTDNFEPVMRKRAPLALNVPTFINLHGYGYENIYELADLVATSDESVNWVSSLVLEEN